MNARETISDGAWNALLELFEHYSSILQAMSVHDQYKLTAEQETRYRTRCDELFGRKRKRGGQKVDTKAKAIARIRELIADGVDEAESIRIAAAEAPGRGYDVDTMARYWRAAKKVDSNARLESVNA
jgi:uncharacterized protein YoaH (UPF0181 family)